MRKKGFAQELYKGGVLTKRLGGSGTNIEGRRAYGLEDKVG